MNQGKVTLLAFKNTSAELLVKGMDFPTVFLIQNDVVKFSFTGTRPVVVIVQWIRVHLK